MRIQKQTKLNYNNITIIIKNNQILPFHFFPIILINYDFFSLFTLITVLVIPMPLISPISLQSIFPRTTVCLCITPQSPLPFFLALYRPHSILHIYFSHYPFPHILFLPISIACRSLIILFFCLNIYFLFTNFYISF